MDIHTLLYELTSHHQSDMSVFIFLYPPKLNLHLNFLLCHTSRKPPLVSLSFSLSPPTADNNSLLGIQPCRLASWLPAYPLLPSCALFPTRPLPGRSLSLYLPHVKIHQHKRLLMRMGRDRAKRKTPQSDKNRSIAEPNGARGTKAIHKLSTAQWTHTSDNPRQTQKG